MIRKFKTLGLAFVAVLAFGALSASAASAAGFHSEVSHTILDGAQPVAEDDVRTVNAGTTKCTSITYVGTMSAATTESFTLTPAHSGCTAFGFINAPIDTNGCTYTFNASNDDMIVTCPEGKTITITAFNCHVSIGSQTIGSGISFHTGGSGKTRDITLTLNLSGTKYTQASKSFPGCTNGTFSNGTYKGSITITGTNTAGEQVGIWDS